MSKEQLKTWIEERRNQMLNKMGANADNPVLKSYYEGAADELMTVLIKMAVDE